MSEGVTETSQNRDNEGESSETAAVRVSIVDPPPAIFKLNIDCFHEIFEWLSVYELINVAGTCKRLHQAAGDYFRINYVSKEIISRYGGIYFSCEKIDTFSEYIPRVTFSCNNLKMNRLISAKCKSLRFIRLEGYLIEDRVENIKEVLKWVQTVDLVDCPNKEKEEFHELFLKHCSDIRSLSIKRSSKLRNNDVIIGSGNEWMFRQYPTLQHLELTDLYELKGNELSIFFEKNPNVRSFSMDSYSLLENQQSLLASDVQLIRLAVEFKKEEHAGEVIRVLVDLYQRGFYKRLHVYSTYISKEHLYQIFSHPFSRSLEMMHGPFDGIETPLINLRMLGISYISHYESLIATNIATNLPNLEQIYFVEASTDHILPFIRQSPTLNIIKIKRFAGGTHYVGGFIDLMALNKEREKLVDAKKVIIFINEHLVLSAKWQNEPINCNLLELKRFASLEWEELNADFRNYHLSYY